MAKTPKQKLIKPEAPPILYVTINRNAEAQFHDSDPQCAENARNEGDRIARYKFDGFVTVGIETVVTDV
jgi:hypothetical protein